MKSIFKQEIDELLLIAFCGLIVLSVWIIFYSWTPTETMVSNDVQGWMFFLRKVYAGEAKLENLLYDFGEGGGMYLAAFSGLSFIIKLCYWLGLEMYSVLNAYVFVTQIVYAYWSIKLIKVLSVDWGIEDFSNKFIRYIYLVALIVISAFAPVVAWRVWACHLQILVVSIMLIGTAVILLELKTNKFSLINYAIYFIFLVISLQSNSFQLLIYYFIFGLPIIVGLLASMPWKQFKIAFLVLCTFFATALLASSTQLLNIWSISKSGDVGRNLNNDTLTFSYTIQTLKDWAGALFFKLEMIKTRDNSYLLHETNYPMGAYVLLFLSFFPWKKSWKMGLGLLLSLLISVIFSSNISWINTLMFGIFPILKIFRVPARALIPYLLFLIPISIASLEYAMVKEKKSLVFSFKNKFFIQITSATIFFFLTTICLDIYFPEFVDVTVLAFVGVFLVATLYKKFDFSPFRRLAFFAFIPIFATYSFFGFKERVPGLSDVGAMLKLFEGYSSTMKKAVPEAFKPLNRSLLLSNLPFASNNTGAVLGLSTVEAYGFLSKDFISFLCSLNNVPFDPTIVNIGVDAYARDLSIFQKLFDIMFIFKIEQRGQVNFQPNTDNTWGPAWVSSDHELAPNLHALTSTLRQIKGSEEQLNNYKDKMLIEADQWNKISTLMRDSTPSVCADIKIASLTYSDNQQKISVRLSKGSATANCPLVISTNHSYMLKAEGHMKNESLQKLTTFRAYGVLLGIIVPAEVETVDVFWDRI